MGNMDLIGSVTILATLLGAILGGTWWLATVHGTVRRTEAETKGISEVVQRIDRRVQGHSIQGELHSRTLKDHEKRLRAIELGK